jgi:cytoskeletal protein CcmA (bactofilin family)
VLKVHAHVVGDIQHQSLAVEPGAFFDGRSVRAPASNMRQHSEKFAGLKLRREAANSRAPAPASAA